MISEWYQLPHTNLAVWTTHIVMSSFGHTSFQKGVERIVGRGSGILLGLLMLDLIGEQRVLLVAVEAVALTAFFYAFYVGRLAYTYQNAGLYLNATLQVGASGSSVAWVQGGWMFLAIVVGVVVADLVNWTTGAERDLSIEPGAGDFVPIRPDLLGRGFQAAATLLASQYVFFALDFPPDSNTFTLFLFSVMPDFQRVRSHYRYFLAGILAGIAYAIMTLLVLNRVLHLPMLVALIFLGEFLASYLAQSPTDLKAIGSEMGQILALLAVVPAVRVQSPARSFYGVLALVAFVAIAWVVGAVATALGIVPDRPYQPAPDPPASDTPGAGQK